MIPTPGLGPDEVRKIPPTRDTQYLGFIGVDPVSDGRTEGSGVSPPSPDEVVEAPEPRRGYPRCN